MDETQYGCLSSQFEASVLSSLSLSVSRKTGLVVMINCQSQKRYICFHLDGVIAQPFVELIHSPVFGTRAFASPLRMGRVMTAGYLFFEHFSIGLGFFLYQDREWGFVDVQKVLTAIIFNPQRVPQGT
jgi:hypothetical protein